MMAVVFVEWELNQDNIAKWREMSAYQMADKYCHYLLLLLLLQPTLIIILKSFMCALDAPIPSL